jgi:signal transduction histidine kinase
VGAVVAEWQGLSLKPGTTLEIDLGHGCELHRILAGPEAEALLAIGREAIVNANRHATGQRICVRLSHDEGIDRLSVEDDGEGGDLDWLQAQIGKPGHLGLSLMQARAQALGGSVSLERSRLGGVRVSVALPADESR